MNKANIYIITAIFLLALTVRLIVVLPDNSMPEGDAYVYDSLAVSLSQGQGYLNSNGTAHSFYPPFYPFFLSLIYRLFGHSYIAVRVIQSMIGALICVFIYLIAKRSRNATLGILSACFAIVYPPFIKSAGLLLTETLFTLLLCLIVYYSLRIRRDVAYKDCAVLGFLMGLGLLTKTALIILPIFTAFIFINKKTALKKYIVVILFFILPVTPWVIRNYSVYHRFVPVATQGGITFYSSYQPPNGIFGTLPSGSTSDPVIIEAGSMSDPVLRNHFLVKKTLDFIINNPGKVIMLELEKVLYLWAPFDWEIVGGRWFNFMYVMMLPFFVIGLFIAFKKFSKFYPILLPIFYFQIITLIFYGSPRFRLPVEPYIFILAMLGLMELCRWVIYRGNFNVRNLRKN